MRGLAVILESPAMLITDDDRDFRETLGGIFEVRGFRTLLAEDGEAAIQIVRREEIHVALLDMHMPRLTGLEAIRHVKQVRAIVPCILISAELDESLAAAAREADAFSSLAKPVRLAEITQMVTQAMRLTYDWPPAR